jgi:hypothetical protein
MSEYSPDSWVVLKIKPGKGMFPFYKVLAGWNGSYTEGSSWRLNSGITLVFDREDEIHFHGESGSVYRCGKETYGLTMSTAAIHQDLYLKQEFKGQIQIMEEDTDWTKLI